MSLEKILILLGDKKEQVLNVYPYGSTAYGTNTEKSDKDYVVVLTGTKGIKDEIKTEEMDITIYDEKSFQDQLDEHEISVIECISLPKEEVVLEKKSFVFTLDKTKLRNSLSKKSSNSWVKTKKKLIVKEDYDPYIAKKSLFHCLRILMYGIQIATNGKVTNFKEANEFYNEIMNIKTDNWDEIQDKYQPIYNSLKSKFKIVCPK